MSLKFQFNSIPNGNVSLKTYFLELLLEDISFIVPFIFSLPFIYRKIVMVHNKDMLSKGKERL